MRRTVLYVIDIWHVDEVALIKLFPVPDLCAALIVFFPRGGASKEKVWNYFGIKKGWNKWKYKSKYFVSVVLLCLEFWLAGSLKLLTL